MSRENLEVVRRIYEQWEKGNFHAGGDLWDRHVVFMPAPDLPEIGDYRGPEEVLEFMREFLKPWATYTIAADALIEAGDSVVVATSQRGVGRESGVVTDPEEQFHVWTFRGHRVVRFEAFRERAEALGAVGLSE